MRALSVFLYLKSQEESVIDRIIYKGYGELLPIETNDTEEGRSKNRRTEFMIISK